MLWRRPGIKTRFVIGLLLLKHICALSDEEVCERWVYDPYFQYFTGEQFTEPGNSDRVNRWPLSAQSGDILGGLFGRAIAHRWRLINLPHKEWHFRDGWDHLMKFDITNFQTLAANLPVEGEVCDLAHAEVSTQTETDTEIAPLIQQVAATSIAEIDQLMAELQEAKNYLQSEGERIEQETVRYTNLTQMASATVRIISDAVSQWHPARNQQNSSASDVAAASAEDNIGAFRKSHHHGQWDMPDFDHAVERFFARSGLWHR
jgi:Transposase domain (DUF772)